MGMSPRLSNDALGDGRIVRDDPAMSLVSGDRNASGADRCVLMLDDQVEPNPRRDDENPEREEQQVAGLLESFTLGDARHGLGAGDPAAEAP